MQCYYLRNTGVTEDEIFLGRTQRGIHILIDARPKKKRIYGGTARRAKKHD